MKTITKWLGEEGFSFTVNGRGFSLSNGKVFLAAALWLAALGGIAWASRL